MIKSNSSTKLDGPIYDRAQLANVRRVVIKAGTSVVCNPDGRFSLSRLAAIVEQIAELQLMGKECILVTSGAVGCGRRQLRKQVRGVGSPVRRVNIRSPPPMLVLPCDILTPRPPPGPHRPTQALLGTTTRQQLTAASSSVSSSCQRVYLSLRHVTPRPPTRRGRNPNPAAPARPPATHHPLLTSRRTWPARAACFTTVRAPQPASLV